MNLTKGLPPWLDDDGVNNNGAINANVPLRRRGPEIDWAERSRLEKLARSVQGDVEIEPGRIRLTDARGAAVELVVDLSPLALESMTREEALEECHRLAAQLRVLLVRANREATKQVLAVSRGN